MSANISSSVESKHSVALMYINLLVPPILVVLGVTFNWFTILTMRTRYFRKVSTSVYLKVGAFNDFLALLVSLVAHWLYVNFPSVYIRTDSSHIMCKFFNFYGSGNNDFGIIVTVSMTAERALVIASPLGAGKLCSVTRAWKIVSALLVLVIVKNCHYLIASDIVPVERTDRLCDVFANEIDVAYDVFYGDIWPWIHMFYVVSCGIAIIVSNSIILHNVRKSFGVKYTGKNQAWRHLVPMLLGESLLLVIFTFPFTLHLAMLSIRIRYNPDLYLDRETAEAENLVFSMTFYMLYSNKCVNFFMYCITGKHFRDGLVLVLMQCACHGRYRKASVRSAIYKSTASSMHLCQTQSTMTREDTTVHCKPTITKFSTRKQRLHPKTTSAAERLKCSLSKKRYTSTNNRSKTIESNRQRTKAADLGKSCNQSNSSISTTGLTANSITPTSCLDDSRKLKSYLAPTNKPTPTNTTNYWLRAKRSFFKDKPLFGEEMQMPNSSESEKATTKARRSTNLNNWFRKDKLFVSKLRKGYTGRIKQFSLRKWEKFIHANTEARTEEVTTSSVCLYLERSVVKYKVERVERTQESVSVYL